MAERSRMSVPSPGAIVLPFPVKRRSTPVASSAEVARARTEGAAIDLVSIIMHRSLQRDEAAVKQLRADRSPTQLLLQAVLQSLTNAQHAEARRLLGKARKLLPDDPALDEALWMLRWLR